ncbi:MAG TPA: alpha/beta hydrolase, partial [Chitinophagaceae bacterium]|nr:alpha/beta hydrolase [Chitinophagaceae bacterium]
SWIPVLDRLSAQREVIAVDLPGHGKTPRLEQPTTIAALADEVTDFIVRNDLKGIDVVGSSMGARLVLELARRGGGVVGAVIALDPGGFWEGWEKHFFYTTGSASIHVIKALKFALPALTGNKVTRSILLAQFSPKPWKISPRLAHIELRGYAECPVYTELLHDLAYGEVQEGAERGSIHQPLVIGWGKADRICFPSQAVRALHLFPDAHLYWFNKSGHFPHWDKPAETAALILRVTAEPKPVAAEESTID